jgi:hypothetical protein
MTSTLLPTWTAYKRSLQLDVKEEPETFHWMQESRSVYEEAKQAIDATPGAREMLMNYDVATYGNEYSDPIFYCLFLQFNPIYSAKTLIVIANQYRYLLNNWDEFVLAQKTMAARKLYNAQQMTTPEIVDFIRTCETYEEGNEHLFGRLCRAYSINSELGRNHILNCFHEILDERAMEKEAKAKVIRHDYGLQPLHAC